MGRFQEVRRAGARRRALLWAAVGITFGFVFVLGRAGARMQRTEERARLRYENENAEIVALTARERELREELAALGETRGIEEELRRKFRVAKEDEQLVVILENSAETLPPSERHEERSFFGWLRDMVRGVTIETYTRD